MHDWKKCNKNNVEVDGEMFLLARSILMFTLTLYLLSDDGRVKSATWLLYFSQPAVLVLIPLSSSFVW